MDDSTLKSPMTLWHLGSIQNNYIHGENMSYLVASIILSILIGVYCINLMVIDKGKREGRELWLHLMNSIALICVCVYLVRNVI